MDDTDTGRAPEVKVYLGDGAYASFDGFSISVTAEDGIRVRERVFLGSEELQRLVDFARRHGMQID